MPAAKTLKRYGLITVACALYALGFNWFFVPNHFTVGGFTGVAQIINHFLPMLPVGTVALVLNIPLFILDWRKIGRDLLISSLYATAVSSLMIDVLARSFEMAPIGGVSVTGPAWLMLTRIGSVAFACGLLISLPIVTSCSGNTSVRPISIARSREAMKSAMLRNRGRCWRGNSKLTRTGADGSGSVSTCTVSPSLTAGK